MLDQPAPHPPLHHHPAANSIDVPGTDVVGPQEMDRAQDNRSQECILTFVNFKPLKYTDTSVSNIALCLYIFIFLSDRVKKSNAH